MFWFFYGLFFGGCVIFVEVSKRMIFGFGRVVCWLFVFFVFCELWVGDDCVFFVDLVYRY